MSKHPSERRLKTGAAMLFATVALLSGCGGGGGSGEAIASGNGSGGELGVAPPAPAPAPDTGGGTAGPPGTPGTPGTPPTATGDTSTNPPGQPAPSEPRLSQTLHLGDLWLNAADAAQLQGYAALARLAGGGYVGVTRAASTADVPLAWQRLDEQGRPVGEPVVFAGGGTAPGVTAMPDGGFLLTWVTPPPPQFTMILGVQGLRVAATGKPVGQPLALGYVGLPGAATPTALSDGRFVLSTFGQSSRVNGPYGFVQRYSASGTAEGAADPLHQDACGIAGAPAATALPDGGFVVAWSWQCLGDAELVTRVYGASGAPVESRLVAPGLRDWSLATLADGRYVLAWTQEADGQPQLRGRIGDATAPFTLAWQAGRQPLPVASLSGGGFVIPWRALDAAEMRVPVDRYDNAGRPIAR